jgi:hypothetical protein
MNRAHVHHVIRPAFSQRNDMVCFVTTWLAADMADRVVGHQDSLGTFLLG